MSDHLSMLEVGGVVVKVFLHAIIGDEEALSFMWNIKGSSGIVPCAVVCCVVNKPYHGDVERGIRSLAERSENIVSITCSDTSRFGLKTDNDVWSMIDNLVASQAHLPTPRFKEMQQRTGFNYQPDSLLFDVELRPYVHPATNNRFDPMHVIFSNGILGLEVMLFLRSARKAHGMYFAQVRAHFAETQWTSPKSRQGQCDFQGCFSEAKEASSNDFLKVGASDLLAVYPAFRHFVVEASSGSASLKREMDSLLLLLEVCDLIKAALRHPLANRVRQLAAKLGQTAALYVEAFKLAYGEGMVRVKHHELLHLAAQLLLDGLLLACWAMERKHIKAKQAFDHYMHQLQLHKGALARLVNTQVLFL